MDPLEKFKADFARLRGEAHQPKGEKPDDKPRPRRKQNKQPNGQAGDEPIGELGAADDQASERPRKEPIEVFWHGDVDYRASRPQLVQDVIPEVGHGLWSGQWGTFKTFGALELAHSCMSGEPFLGYEIMRRGGVLFIALEGAGEVPIRLQGVIEDRGNRVRTVTLARPSGSPPSWRSCAKRFFRMVASTSWTRIA
jgi:hypothetical protein